MQNLLVISSLLQCKIHSKNNFSQILGSLGGIQYSDLILTGTCNAAAAGSVAVTGDSDGEWVMGGGRRAAGDGGSNAPEPVVVTIVVTAAAAAAASAAGSFAVRAM